MATDGKTPPGQPGESSPPLPPATGESAALHPDRAQALGYLRLILIGALIGIPAALMAAFFLALVHWSEDLLWTDLPEWLGEPAPPAYLVIGLPVVGALIVAVARRFLPGDGGHSPMDGIGGGPTPWQYGPGIALAAFGTLAFGAVLGPEAPLIALGSVVGMIAVSAFRVQGPGRTTLATAGSFSAVSALFGGPLVAGMLLLEGGLAAGTALIPALLPGLTAAAIGYVLFVGFGDWGGLSSTALAVPDLPEYTGLHPGDLALAVVVGIVTSLLVSLIRRGATAVDRAATGSTGRTYGVLVLGGLLVGVTAQAARWLGADSQAVLFSGQASLPEVLAEGSVGLLLVLIVAKGIGYAICLGCGFRGGPVFPAIFIGVAIASIACVVLDTSITWAVAVGAAAGMTAGTGMVFSAVLFSGLLAGSNGMDAIPAAVVAVVAAWLTNAALKRRAAAATAPSEP